MRSPAHNVQWQSPGLYQFSLEMDTSPYYVDLTQCMTSQTLSGSNAGFTLTGCGISGLDGDYWIARQDGNEVWVEKNNQWAIVFTNDDSYTPEFCRSSSDPAPSTSSPSAKPTTQITPSPTDPIVTDSPQATPGPSNPPQPMTPPPTVKATTLSPTSPPTITTNKPTSKPTSKPTITPTSKPTSKPTAKPVSCGETVCCADRNTGYQSCNSNSWCNMRKSNCNACAGVMLTVPLTRTGCCSWGGDCSSVNPNDNKGCQYMKSDCEGSCGGTWQSF